MDNIEEIDISAKNIDSAKEMAESKIKELENKISEVDDSTSRLAKELRQMLSGDEMLDGKISYDELKVAFKAAKISNDEAMRYAEILGIKHSTSFVLFDDPSDYLYWVGVVEGGDMNEKNVNFDRGSPKQGLLKKLEVYRDDRRDSFLEKSVESFDYDHPYYGKLKVVDFPINKDEIAAGDYWLDGFDPTKINTTQQSSGEKLVRQLESMHAEIRCFHDPEQIKRVTSVDNRVAMLPLNINSDLGLRFKLRQMHKNDILSTLDENGNEIPNFVILTHGHPIAGLVELAKMKTSDDKVLFDTAVYMPSNGWTESANRALHMSSQAQMWGDELERVKGENTGKEWAGGMAIALNGHRGDLDYDAIENGGANIDAYDLFGDPKEFEKFLISRNMKKIVIITEHGVKDSKKDNILPLTILKDSNVPTFNNANEDLYDYMKEVSDRGNVEVVVISGDTRKGIY